MKFSFIRLCFITSYLTINNSAFAKEQIYFNVISATIPEHFSDYVPHTHKNDICIKKNDFIEAMDRYTYELLFGPMMRDEGEEDYLPIFILNQEVKFKFHIDIETHEEIVSKVKNQKKVCLKAISYQDQYYKKTGWFSEKLDYTIYRIMEIELDSK